MIEFLLFLLVVIVSGIMFEILFYALNNSILRLFVPIQNHIGKIKNKKILKYFLYLISLLISVIIKQIFSLNYLIYGICLGFFYSFSTMIVGESIVKA